MNNLAKTNQPAINLKVGCSFYTKSIQRTLQDLFNIEVNSDLRSESVNQLEDKEDLYFSILVTGQIYGEFLFGLSRKTALKMLGYECEPGREEETYWKNRIEILDAFKEVINIAAGKTLGKFKDVLPELSITPPKAIEGQITLSAYKIERTRLVHAGGNLSCYIYLDYMKLEITETLEREKEQLSKELAKQDELKRLDKAKSEFLANMSHELRTPLNGMIGMLDILKGSHLSHAQKEQFDIVYRSGEFLLSLISDILEFSKIESGKLELEQKPFLLRDSIESAVESLANVVLGKGLEYNVTISPKIYGQYLGDETRIKQVLVNLIGNAVKFTPTGSISVLADIDSENRICLRVVDTGVGIPADKLETIFASFSQVDASDNRKYGGTGLGLTISKSIVRAMNGSIAVQSAEAQGSEFKITLPLLPVDQTAAAIQVANLDKQQVRVSTQNSRLNETLRTYISSLHNNVVLSSFDLDQGSKFEKSDILIIDFQDWLKLPVEHCQALAKKMQDQNYYLVFVTHPKDLEAANKLPAELGLKNMYFLNLPMNLARLAKALGERPALSASRQPATLSAPIIAPLSNRKVLVAEDNQVNQVVITTMLKQLGYTVEVANDGKEASQKIEQGGSYDFILMDCQMPVMNGYEATIEIRKIEASLKRNTPIIALTANAFRETKEACFECGMDDFATKPIKFDTLKEVIKRTTG